ncbi:hypothetical protein GQ44DRAFT_606187 [Phaeosphaeriaceae sp. PMI808]|nr:hypothetical protein GQ44DRAFT_606187 [Phaeosphaeriaceae sp. PMI808]
MDVVNNSPELDRVRDTMSFSNILTSSDPTTSIAAAAPEVPTNVTLPAATSAPTTPLPKTPTTPHSDAKTNGDVGSPDSITLDVTMDDGEEESDAVADDVPDHLREFICQNDNTKRCVTGQYEMKYSRKVISDHFGRNKACTRHIKDWPLFCRKHYQRATYDKPSWQKRKLDLIFRQFEVIETQFPGTTYQILFKKSENERINEYVRKVATAESEFKRTGDEKELKKQLAEIAKAYAPVSTKTFEAPIEILQLLDNHVGKGKTKDEARDVVQFLFDEINEGRIEQVPSIEFLPSVPGKMDTPKKVLKTPSPKKLGKVKTPKSKGTPGRVSAKGSVKKPNQKD